MENGGNNVFSGEKIVRIHTTEFHTIMRLSLILFIYKNMMNGTNIEQ